MALKTDYKDDILDLTQNDKRCFEEIQNQDGSTSFRDVTVYEQEGDNFGAQDINATNEAVNQLDDNLTASDNLKFQFTKSGNDYGYKDSNGNFHPFNRVQASKTVTAGTSAKTVSPDSGYHGIASVTVNPTPSQSKSVTATTSAQTISPDSGKLLSSVTVNPQVHSGTRASVTSNGTIDLGVTHNIRYVPVSVTNTLNLQNKGTTYGNTTLTGLASGDIIIGWIGWTGGENITLSNATRLYNGEMGADLNIWKVSSSSCTTSGVPGSTGIVWFRIYRS